MADCSNMWIKIGGTLQPADLDEFVELLVGEVGPDDWDNTFANEDDVLSTVCDHNDKPLRLFKNDRVGGTYDELTDFCRAKGLPYVRGDDGHFDYDGTISYWSPGMGAIHDYYCTHDGEPMASNAELQHWRKEGRLDAEVSQMSAVASFNVPFVGPPRPPKEEEDAEDETPLVQTPVDRLLEAVLSSRREAVDVVHLQHLAQAVLDQKETADGE